MTDQTTTHVDAKERTTTLPHLQSVELVELQVWFTRRMPEILGCWRKN